MGGDDGGGGEGADAVVRAGADTVRAVREQRDGEAARDVLRAAEEYGEERTPVLVRGLQDPRAP